MAGDIYGKALPSLLALVASAVYCTLNVPYLLALQTDLGRCEQGVVAVPTCPLGGGNLTTSAHADLANAPLHEFSGLWPSTPVLVPALGLGILCDLLYAFLVLACTWMTCPDSRTCFCCFHNGSSVVFGPFIRFFARILIVWISCAAALSQNTLCLGDPLAWQKTCIPKTTQQNPDLQVLDENHVPAGAKSGRMQKDQQLAWLSPGFLYKGVRTTVGDGNCLWGAIAPSLGCRWFSLKRRTLAHLRMSDDLSDDQHTKAIHALNKKNAWGNEVALQGIANLTGRDVFVWHCQHVIQFKPLTYSNSLPITVALQQSH